MSERIAEIARLVDEEIERQRSRILGQVAAMLRGEKIPQRQDLLAECQREIERLAPPLRKDSTVALLDKIDCYLMSNHDESDTLKEAPGTERKPERITVVEADSVDPDLGRVNYVIDQFEQQRGTIETLHSVLQRKRDQLGKCFRLLEQARAWVMHPELLSSRERRKAWDAEVGELLEQKA